MKAGDKVVVWQDLSKYLGSGRWRVVVKKDSVGTVVEVDGAFATVLFPSGGEHLLLKRDLKLYEGEAGEQE